MLILLSTNIVDMILDLIHAEVSLSDGSGFGKNLILFGTDMSSSVHVDNKKKYILILGKELTDGLNDTMLTAENEYFDQFCEQHKKIFLSLHYNGANSYVLANGVDRYKFKAKDSEIDVAPLCLGSISKDFSVDNMKKTKLYGYVYNFSVDYNATAVNDNVSDIHKYLMKKNGI